MTVATTNTTSSGTGDGVTTTFPFTFRVLDPTHIEVYKATVLQTYITNYTVVLNAANVDGEQGSIGGNIVFGVAPANGSAIAMNRVTPLSQALNLSWEAALSPDALENAYDKAILIAQEQAADIAAGVGGGGGGTGDVVGPSSATNRSVALFSGTTGKLLKDGVALGSSGQVLTSQGASADPIFASLPTFGDVVGPASATDRSVALYSGATGKLLKDGVALGSSGQVLTSGGAGVDPTFTTLSVSANDPSPLFTTSETGLGITFTQITKAANLVFAGPASGGAVNPDFRALDPLDIPPLDAAKIITGTFGIARIPTITAAKGGLNLDTSASAKGGVPYLSAAGVWSILPVGADNQAFIVNVDVPNWEAASTGDVVGPASATDRSVALFSGATGKLLKDGVALGTAGQALVSNGAGADPTFQTIAGTGDVVGPASATDRSVALYSGATGKLIKDGVALGTSGQVLTSNGAGADPTFQTVAGTGDVVGPASATDRSVALFGSGTGKLLKDGVALGSAGQFLGSNGVGADPTFQTPAISANDHPQGLFTTTESGLSLTFVNVTQAANIVYAGPASGGAVAPTFRALVALDMPATVAFTNAANSWSTAQLPNAAGTIDLGSSALPFKNLIFGGAATNNTKLVSATTTAQRTCTFPDANSNPVQPDTGAANNFLTACSSAGLFSKAQPAFSNISGIATAAQGTLGIDTSASAKGGIPYLSAAGVWSILAIGADTKALTVATDVPAWTAPSVTAGDLSPLFTTSESGTSITFAQVNQNANLVFSGPASGSAAAPTFRALTLLDLIGSASRAMPTSGTITSGLYYNVSGWASSANNGIIEDGVHVYNIGTFALNHTGWTIGTGAPGGGGSLAAGGNAAQAGQGLGGGGRGGSSVIAGAGGGYGGAGGTGASTAAQSVPGGNTYLMNAQLGGSGGGGGASDTGGTSPSGGRGGGGWYLFSTGAVSFNESLSSTGEAGGAGLATNGGGAGGGSGGGFDIASLVSVTIAASKVLSVPGGVGGIDAGTSGGGGGGGGGRGRCTAPTVTVTGTQTAVGAAGGVGNTTGGTGSNGVWENITSTPFPRFF